MAKIVYNGSGVGLSNLLYLFSCPVEHLLLLGGPSEINAVSNNTVVCQVVFINSITVTRRIKINRLNYTQLHHIIFAYITHVCRSSISFRKNILPSL